LLSYEIHGIKKCGRLIRAGISIEKELGITGQFRSRPHDAAGFINEPFATSIIYPAVLAAWTYLAFIFAPPMGSILASLVFLGFFALTLWWTSGMEGDLGPRNPEDDLPAKEPNIEWLLRLLRPKKSVNDTNTKTKTP